MSETMTTDPEQIIPENIPDAGDGSEDEAMADDARGIQVPTLDHRSQSISSDVRDSVLEIFERVPKPWSALSESEQLSLSRMIDSTVNLAIAMLAEHIIDEGAPAIVARLDRVLLKNGDVIECKLTFPNDQECRDVLGAAVGTDIRVTAIDTAALAGLYRKPQTMPDEPELPMASEEAPEEVDTSYIPDDPDDGGTALTYSEEVRNARLDQIEAEIPAEPLTGSKRRRKVA